MSTQPALSASDNSYELQLAILEKRSEVINAHLIRKWREKEEAVAMSGELKELNG